MERRNRLPPLFSILYLLASVLRAAAADFTVHADQPISPPLVGFGACMNPYVYATPNYAEPLIDLPFTLQNNPLRQGPLGFGDITEQNVRDYESKVIALAPQHVRIFMLLDWWSLRGDTFIAKGDPRMVDSFIRTVRLAQRAGATVNLTLWYGREYFNAKPELTGEYFAQVLNELIETHGLTCIKYVTIQNEVNGPGEYGGMRLTFPIYDRLYRGLDAALKRLHLRKQIKIISGDLLGTNQAMWLNHLAYYLHDVSDGYSIHVYWDYWDTPKLKRRINETADMYSALPEELKRPMYITEFGLRGFRSDDSIEPGFYWDGRQMAESNLQSLEIAWFMLESLNHGFVATVQWDMADVWYDRRMHYGVIGEPLQGWPLKPAYHVLKLFTHTTSPGSKAIKIDGEKQFITVAATRSGNGITIYALNRSEEPSTISFAGLPFDTPFRIVESSGTEHMGVMQTSTPQDFAVEIPRLSLVAITNCFVPRR